MKRSKFSLSHYNLFSCRMGILYPAGCMEVLPGDSFRHSASMLVRCASLLAPVMHPVEISCHHWYVPYRLIWDDFEKFITGGPDGNDATEFPTITFGSAVSTGELADYLGVPTDVAGLEVSALPFRAYHKIFNEFYRDQDLTTERVISTASGADSTTDTSLARPCWPKDYFTSARPWEQKGDDVTLPLGTEAPVLGIGVQASADWNQSTTVRETGGGTPSYSNAASAHDSGAGKRVLIENDGSNFPAIYADLSQATAASVNAIRQAFALQRFKEMRARFGSRYSEYLRALGVRSSDARLARPEYLGGGKQTMQFSEILQTAGTTDGSATGVGDLKGHGIAAMRSNRYRRFFEEHGVVITMFFVRPTAMYFQGLHRSWNRRTKEDFWQPELQHIGQQSILNKELYAAHATPEGVFGYQDRYDEYRRMPSRIAGEFHDSELNFWHFARDFSSDPALNDSFVQCIPTERTFAVTTNDILWVMARHSVQARRLVAKSGTSFIR